MIGAKEVIKAIHRKGHILFERTDKPYNLNFIAVRDIGGQWNDQFILMWKYKTGWAFVPWMGTTDPGAFYLKKPLNVKGTMILPEGQHRGFFKKGKHRGRYKCLKPAREVGVYRIPKGWTYADIEKLSDLTLDIGWHGSNYHRAHTEVEVKKIGLYSAGCQVAQNIDEYGESLHITDQGFKHWGDTLTYTILNVNDF